MMAQVIEVHRVDAARAQLRPVVRATLERLLGGVEIRVDDHGRPWAEGVSFNVSHSGAIGLIAVAEAGRRVGIDIQQVRESTDFRALAARFFHPGEAAAIGDRRDAFFRCWTRKEAVVKALGLGLHHPLTSFVVDVDAEGPQPVEGVPGLWVTGLDVEAGYAAALAADGDVVDPANRITLKLAS
jgi:phosphopantetheinyl transferase